MPYSILIVDDSKLARMAAAKALNSLHPDWVRMEAASASDALERVRQQSPDFVLVDFNMPEKDGISLAAEVRELDPAISVAVISANRQAGVIQRAEAAGAAFLPKPLTEASLEEFLRSALHKRKESPNG